MPIADSILNELKALNAINEEVSDGELVSNHIPLSCNKPYE